jgi:hypothetical protein
MNGKIFTAVLLLSITQLHGSDAASEPLGPNHTPADAKRFFVAKYNEKNEPKINATDVEIVFGNRDISNATTTLRELGVPSERDLAFGVPLANTGTRVWMRSLSKTPW